jgi:hypothetical protein
MNGSKEEENAKAEEASVAIDSTVANGVEGNLKTDTSLADVNAAIIANNTIASTGDVELTANFPQKVRSTNLIIFHR